MLTQTNKIKYYLGPYLVLTPDANPPLPWGWFKPHAGDGTTHVTDQATILLPGDRYNQMGNILSTLVYWFEDPEMVTEINKFKNEWKEFIDSLATYRPIVRFGVITHKI